MRGPIARLDSNQIRVLGNGPRVPVARGDREDAPTLWFADRVQGPRHHAQVSGVAATHERALGSCTALTHSHSNGPEA